MLTNEDAGKLFTISQLFGKEIIQRVYMLTSTRYNEYALIALIDGNRYIEPTTLENLNNFLILKAKAENFKIYKYFGTLLINEDPITTLKNALEKSYIDNLPNFLITIENIKNYTYRQLDLEYKQIKNIDDMIVFNNKIHDELNNKFIVIITKESINILAIENNSNCDDIKKETTHFISAVFTLHELIKKEYTIFLKLIGKATTLNEINELI